MNLFCEYIQYKFKSKGKHQIHSPFVFDFVSRCIRIKRETKDRIALDKLYRELKNNTQKIQVSDFGRGSKTLTSTRSIAQIYKTASSKGVYADLLFQVVKHYSCSNVLELGTSLGIGTIHLALGNREAKITTVDACQKTQDQAKLNCQKMELKSIGFIHSDFESFLNGLTPRVFDLIFIDGHHDGSALLNYMDKLDAFSDENTIFVVDDIRWSPDMLAAWNQLRKDESFHLSMDLFRMGILIKRKQQAKEHFVVRMKNVILSMI